MDFSDDDKEPIDELGDSPGRLDVEGPGRLSVLLLEADPVKLSGFGLPETSLTCLSFSATVFHAEVPLPPPPPPSFAPSLVSP